MGPMTSPDSLLAVRIAQETGRALVELRETYGPVRDESHRRELMDAGDRVAQGILARRLTENRPGDAVLSEEAADSDARLGADRVWINDPLDGTKEFGLGRVDFAVHVALWQRSATSGPRIPAGSLTDAAVDVPALGETWDTASAGTPGPLPGDRPLRLMVSRTRPPAGTDQLMAAVSADLADHGLNAHGMEVSGIGSVGAKLGEVMAGRAEAYLHPGGLNEWDLAAPHACALAHGLVALGPEQPFNRMPPVAGPVLIAHPALVDIMAAHWPAR